MFRNLHVMFLCDSPSYGKHFNNWLKRDDVTEELADQIRAMGRSFVYDFLKDVRKRLQPYWKFIMACETIDPCVPRRIEAWDGVKEICRRCLPHLDASEVVKELKLQHLASAEWCKAEISACRTNLLRYYRDRRAQRKREGKSKPSVVETFAMLVFSIHISSSVVEGYFSKTNYTKSKYRSSMRDEVSSAFLHIKETRDLVDNEILQTSSGLGLDLDRACREVERNLLQLRKRYLHVKVVKSFVDGVTGEVKPYSGHVEQVAWDSSEGCYMFHVRYEDDGDEEDMEHWELKKYVQEDGDTGNYVYHV